MRLYALFAFLVIQFISFALWQGVHAWKNPKAEPVKIKEPAKELSSHEAAQPKLSHVRFAAKGREDGAYLMSADKKSEVVEVLKKLPPSHLSELRNLVLDYSPDAHRGLGGKNIIILRAVNIEREEFTGVMIHEIGHNVDLGYLSENDQSKMSEFKDGQKPIYEGDISLEFYRISWENDRKRKKTASNLDFVSGYAMTDPFEDFAESYIYYVLHNKEFKSLAQTSNQILAKYRFMKNKVFGGKEFDTGQYATESLKRRPWDITVLSYNLESFLSS